MTLWKKYKKTTIALCIILALLWLIIGLAIQFSPHKDQSIEPYVFYVFSGITILLPFIEFTGLKQKVIDKLRALQGAVLFFAFGILNNLAFNVPYLTNIFYILSGVMILYLILDFAGRIDHKK